MVAELGTPTETLKDWGESCDVYKIYTHGHGTGERVAIASGEVVADIGTLCLAELFLTPAEIATKTSRYTVLVCYGVDNKVASIRESGNPTPN